MTYSIFWSAKIPDILINLILAVFAKQLRCDWSAFERAVVDAWWIFCCSLTTSMLVIANVVRKSIYSQHRVHECGKSTNRQNSQSVSILYSFIVSSFTLHSILPLLTRRAIGSAACQHSGAIVPHTLVALFSDTSAIDLRQFPTFPMDLRDNCQQTASKPHRRLTRVGTRTSKWCARTQILSCGNLSFCPFEMDRPLTAHVSATGGRNFFPLRENRLLWHFSPGILWPIQGTQCLL